MPLIEITEKNKYQYGGKCVVLQSHIHDKKEVKPGEVVTKNGMDYFEALKCKLVRNYDPALDEDLPLEEKRETINEKKVVINDSESSDVSRLSSIDNEKKLGPKKKTKKVKE